jgi:transposase
MDTITGSPWRDLPEEYGSWSTVYSRFGRWTERGIWNKIFIMIGEDKDLENIMINGSYIRAHQHAAGARGARKTGSWTQPGRIYHKNSRYS